MTTHQSESYRYSHQADEIPIRYDRLYAKDPWHRFLWAREQRLLTRIVKEYFQGRPVNLLDFACGTGRWTQLLEPLVTTSIGVDISPAMLGAARQKLARTELFEADLTTDNVLKGRKFNLITAFRFFLNAEPELRKAVLATLVSLLSEDGYLVFNNHRNAHCPLIAMMLWRAKWTGEQPTHTMNFGEMYEMVAQAGLEIVKVYPVGIPRLPRVNLPMPLNHALETIGAALPGVARLSESPMVVCRLRR